MKSIQIPLIDRSSYLKFDTIYIPNAVMKYVLNGENIQFINRQINSKKANQFFLELKNALGTKNDEIIEFHLSRFINSLKLYSQKNEKEYSGLNFNHFNHIKNYIDHNINDKFCLNELSKIANINKFGFVKKFKSTTGMTPMNYILMRKIFSSKKLIEPKLRTYYDSLSI